MLDRFVRNPLTRKRLRRFQARRRAYWSLWILLSAYAISLGSELICNDRPLVMRDHGRLFFPIFRYHPEDAFLHNGKQTRPDYRALQILPAFSRTPGNFMIFPPVPFGPYESIDPAALQDATTITATFTPVPRVGSVNMDAAFRVVSAQACGYFFATNDQAVVGAALAAHWPIAPALREAVSQRLRNRSAPAFEATLADRLISGRAATLSMPAYTPREEAPTSVRLTFREARGAAKPGRVTFRPDGQAVTRTFPRIWQQLAEADRARLRAGIARAMEDYIPATQISVGDALYRVEIRKQAITWPHQPVRGHWMGIDSAGRDVFARILYGFRISMSFGFLLVLATMALGAVIGGVQGYFGGATDLMTQRVIEIWSALPFLYVMILLGAVFGPSFTLLLVCYGIFNWIGISYYLRAEFLRLRRQSYVEAARCLGVPAWRIMFEHIFPNAITPMITFFPFSLVGAIYALCSLDYLGFGLPPPTPSWGELLFQAQQFRWAWWLILYPSAAIFAVMLLGVFVGEGIRDAFDPKPFSKME